jgi:hypothetical protein
MREAELHKPSSSALTVSNPKSRETIKGKVGSSTVVSSRAQLTTCYCCCLRWFTLQPEEQEIYFSEKSMDFLRITRRCIQMIYIS